MRTTTPCGGIKQTLRRLVKLALGLSAVFWLFPLDARARAPASDEVGVTGAAPGDSQGPLPEIEAKTFTITVKKLSRSGRVYVFETADQQPLHAGKILLLRRNNRAVMAFRVLRDYSDKNQFAAKWIRRYRGIQKISPNQDFLAIEKVADREAPPLSPQDHADLKEMESDIPAPDEGVRPYDPELDASTTPPPKGSADQSDAARTLKQQQNAEDLTASDAAELDALNRLSAEELVPLDRDWNWLSLGFGDFRNNGAGPGSYSGYFTGFDAKYGKTLRQMLLFKKKNVQDSLVLEGGLGYYKAVNFASPTDEYTVLPLTVAVRYSVLLGENLWVFAYLGLNKNFVLSSGTANAANSSAVVTADNQLNSLLPAAGIGMFFRIGPGWYIRMDAGADLIGLGLTLRF